MKTSAVIRIILWSMVVVLLTCILAVGLSGGELLGRPLPFGFSGVGFSGSGFSYPDAGRYTAGGGSFPADQVDSIEINWVSGGVTVRSYEGSELAFDETIRGQADDSMRMRHYLKDRTLVIQFCAPRQSVFRSANSPVKTLEILVPESLAARMDEAEISVASASIQVSGITADKLEIDSVSGSTDITDTSCRSFELDTVSGSVRSSGLTAGSAETDSVSGPVQLEGSFGRIQYDTISGSFRVGSAICPERIEGSSVSGSVHITIPENDGFTADYDRVSGDFSSDFPTTGDKGRRVYKDGGARFSFDTISGDISILRG
ncbi:DUF4097 family beta strand repeat-containing protein [Anaerotruncus sp. DFI.9.16]|uniref:DUF4097 family beta strand repeat-containing protein n=1 Tax=Anaerotruncus sp. DFI.9.16 TaxID=2965275 RepID=UPI0021095DEB|nr:DUF4097 family beta strand repeat-containing protein [Anaerotruncus sp. DFI.9.16]MCQ4894368.1 DUF4097 domain-containing protein [Anaerotruncus sp. DFI.9.16]